jgi:phage gp29-like protein
VETSVIELQKTMFNTLYIWIFAHHSLLISSFAEFLNVFFIFFRLGVFLYAPCVLELHPFVLIY